MTTDREQIKSSWRKALMDFVLRKKLARGDEVGGFMNPNEPPDLPLVDGIYTKDPDYLFYTSAWEDSVRKQALYSLVKAVGPGGSATDFGCATGSTGIELLLQGYSFVQFVDFEGLGLEFLREFLPTQFAPETFEVVPFGGERATAVTVAADVLEHVGCELRLIRWLQALSKRALFFTYPLEGKFHAPYRPQVDNWVDDEGVQAAFLSSLSSWQDGPVSMASFVVGGSGDRGRMLGAWR